ncbi:MAG: hypothetical protein NTY09_13310 [bacterium]|nr:hypothetical protein [bacterium]
MKNTPYRSLLIVVITLLLMAGCSSNNSQPIAPNEAISQPVLTGNADAYENNADASNHYMLAYNLIYIDPDAPEGPKIEVIPVRETEIHLNVLKFLEGFPCATCFKIVGFNIPMPGYLYVDIEVDHPFTDLTYSIFDVRGIMMFHGTHQYPVAGKLVSDSLLGNGALLNADGYTALFNGSTITAPVGDLQKYYQGKFATSAIPDSDINGFRYYITDNPANNRNAFFAGSSDVQTYLLKLPQAPLVLGYAVDASWWTPISTPVDDPLTDFDTNANCPEPWKISVIEQPINQGLTDLGGQTKLQINVYDWQGKSTYHAPVIECPEIFNGTKSSTWVMDSSSYSQYEVTISNSKLASAGEYTSLIRVEDNGNDPVGSPWLDLSAYKLQKLTVTHSSANPCEGLDESEPNDTAGNADSISDYDIEGHACNSEIDWFVLEGQEGNNPTITLSYDDTSCNIDLEVYSDSSYIGGLDNPGSPDSDTFNVPGTCYLKIWAVTGAGDYTIDISGGGPSDSPTDFFVHAFIVSSNSGSNPAASEAKVQEDIDWANHFYDIWFGGSVTLSAISYINKTSWLSLTVDESWYMHQQYHTTDGTVNVYYVNDFPDMEGAAAYTYMECQYSLMDSQTTYVAMCDYGTDATLAHEMGHAVGLLGDMYLFDFGYNCNDIKYCDTGPTGVFCTPSDASWGNLMYWPNGTMVSDYCASDEDIGMSDPPIDSQAENMMYFNTHWPNAFKEP